MSAEEKKVSLVRLRVKAKTYKPPNRKIPEMAIFCDFLICNFQTTLMGNINIDTSVQRFRTDVDIKNPVKLMHRP